MWDCTGKFIPIFGNTVPAPSKTSTLGWMQIESEPANYDSDSDSDESILSSNFGTSDFESGCPDEADQFLVLITRLKCEC